MTDRGLHIDMQTLARSELYNVMNQVILPRPIAWVVTAYGPGHGPGAPWNLAPYSYFNAVSSDPPTIMLGINSRDHPDGVKDTVRNLRLRGDFTVSVPSAGMEGAITDTSAELDWGESEAVRCGVDLVSCADWSVPRVAGCKIALACRLLNEIDLGDPTQSLIVARVQHIWIDRSVITSPGESLRIDLAALRPLARAGRGQFLQMTPRPIPSPGQ